MYCNLGGFENRHIVSYRNEGQLARRIAPFTYSKRKQDCLDLPDKVYQTFQIELTTEQKKLYHDLEKELLLELEQGLVDGTLAITRMMRLQQILCGHLTIEGAAIEIPSHRAEYVSTIVDQADKSIVFCRFRKDVDLVTKQLSADGIKSIGITGADETDDRMGLIDQWRSNKDIPALVMTIATGGVGLTLNESHNTIFYSNSWSSTDRLQAEDRNHRIGQRDKVTYTDLIAPGTVDVKLLQALKAKENLAVKFRNKVEIQRFLMQNGHL